MANKLNPYRAAVNVGRRIREAVDTNTKPTGRQSVSSEQVDKAPVREWAKAVTQEVSAMARQAKDDRATKIARDAAVKRSKDADQRGTSVARTTSKTKRNKSSGGRSRKGSVAAASRG